MNLQHDWAESPVAQDYGDVIGTPFKVFLSNGVTEKLDNTSGKIITEIVDLPGLIASILQTRVLHPRKLSGDDLKYIRSALHLRSADVAVALDVSPEHYSRCESGTKTLSSSAEKYYRMYVFLAAAFKHTDVLQKNVDCSLEEAKETLNAFRSVFLKMKIEHIFDAKDELGFSFSRRSCRDDPKIDCGKEDGKWRTEQLEAA